MMQTKVERFVAHERPNALCAVCLLPTRIGGGKMVRATHDVTRGYQSHMACDGHAERAARWALNDGRGAMSQLALPGAMRRVLSYGGGTDSLAMLLRALQLGIRIDMVAFVDVADPEHLDPGEWPGTYRHIDEHLRPLLARERIPFEVIDSKRYPVRDARSLFAWLKARRQIPVSGPNRICTAIAKVERFEKWAASTYPGEQLEVWIGFEAGEEKRAEKDPNAGKGAAWRVNRFPLIEWGLCRCRSEALIRAEGFPVPRKSACVFCPYATRGDFQTLAVELPETFERIAALEADKPPTRNGAKLSIKNFRTITHANGTKEYRPTMLPQLVQGKPYRARVDICTVCHQPKAQKATGCSYQPEETYR